MTSSHRISRPLLAVVALAALLAASLLAIAGPSAAKSKRSAKGPDVIALPDGFQPEGIASGKQHTLFVGSIPTGAIFRIDAKTGQGSVFVPGRSGRQAIGLKASKRFLHVAGGPTGKAFFYDARTGADVGEVTLTTDPSFVNDVTLTKDAAYFTDSVNQRLYRVALGRKGAPATTSTPLPLTGALQYDGDPSTFELNGIAAAGRGTLLAVQSRTGKLFAIDAATGVTREVTLTGGDLANGDGLLLRGRTLYAVQNRLNRIAVVKLSGDLSRGEIVRTITDSDFQVPTTVAALGSSLYLPNARFGTPPTPTTKYDVVRVSAAGSKGRGRGRDDR